LPCTRLELVRLAYPSFLFGSYSDPYYKTTSLFAGVFMPLAYAFVFGLSLFGIAGSNRAFATVLSGRIEGACRIVALDECKLSFFGDVNHDVSTPIIAARVLANGVVLHEHRNDAINPNTDLSPLGWTVLADGFLAARCGQTYILELQVQATDDVDFKSVATTREIPCPSSVP
jgi:hypothetical protein